MSDVFNHWSRDHKNFAYLLDLLEEQIECFVEDQTPNYDLMLDILYYMTHYPDLFHHPKEDLASARIMERDASAAAVFDELARQHVVLRDSGAELLAMLEGILEDAMLKRENVVQSARTYVAYFRAHMEKEESEVVPLMQALLDKDDWAAIEKAAPFQQDPLFGSGALEKRYEVLHRQIMQQSGHQAAV